MKYDFKNIDANSDKKITRKEMNVAYGLHHKFEEIDTNQDEIISLVEFNDILSWTEVLSVMKKWDKNKDNQLSFLEFQAYHNAAEIPVHRCTMRK